MTKTVCGLLALVVLLALSVAASRAADDTDGMTENPKFKFWANAKPGAKPEEPGTPMPEIGWGPVNFPFPGGTEPIVMGLIDGTPMFHWHFETFDLPKLPAPPNPAPPPAPPPPTGNALLTSSKLCRNQAFRFKTRLFGFQFDSPLAFAERAAGND